MIDALLLLSSKRSTSSALEHKRVSGAPPLHMPPPQYVMGYNVFITSACGRDPGRSPCTLPPEDASFTLSFSISCCRESSAARCQQAELAGGGCCDPARGHTGDKARAAQAGGAQGSIFLLLHPTDLSVEHPRETMSPQPLCHGAWVPRPLSVVARGACHEASTGAGGA